MIKPYPRVSRAQNVIYWGQNGGDTVENNDLSTYCTSSAGIHIIVLSFLYDYGNGNTIPSGTIGQSCSISASGEPSQCDDLADAIKTCQSNGVKIILSLGGAIGTYSLSSQEEAETISQKLWDAYGRTQKSCVPRPFGSTFVNGWGFDIEAARGNQYYQHLIRTLRSNFVSDSSNMYYITGSPQCPIPEPNMQQIITSSQFDYLWVPFYNNPSCSVNGPINYDVWVSAIAGTPSANAKIFIGVPASPNAATGTSSGAQYYLEPSSRLWFVDTALTPHLVELRCGLPSFPIPTSITVAHTPRKVNLFSPPTHLASTITQFIQKPRGQVTYMNFPFHLGSGFEYVLNQSNRCRDTCAFSSTNVQFQVFEYKGGSPKEEALCCFTPFNYASGCV